MSDDDFRIEREGVTDSTEDMARLAFIMSTQASKEDPVTFIMPSSCLSRASDLVLSAALLGPLADMKIPEIVFTLACVVSIDIANALEGSSKGPGRLQYLSRLAMEIWDSNRAFTDDSDLCSHVRGQTAGLNLGVLHEFLSMARADHLALVAANDEDILEEETFEYFQANVPDLWSEDLKDFQAKEAGASA